MLLYQEIHDEYKFTKLGLTATREKSNTNQKMQKSGRRHHETTPGGIKNYCN
jgi:hypothetical protein